MSIPENLEPYYRTPVYNATTVPDKLTQRHLTKAGTWVKIHVEAGNLTFTEIGKEPIVIPAGSSHVIEPEVAHFVSPEEPVTFYLQFYSADR